MPAAIRVFSPGGLGFSRVSLAVRGGLYAYPFSDSALREIAKGRRSCRPILLRHAVLDYNKPISKVRLVNNDTTILIDFYDCLGNRIADIAANKFY